MSKSHVPNAQAKAIGQAHKSGASDRSRMPKSKDRDKQSAPIADNAPAAKRAKTGPHRPASKKTAVQKPQAAAGDDDLMSQPQPFPPVITTAND
jgi:hypothetical protein